MGVHSGKWRPLVLKAQNAVYKVLLQVHAARNSRPTNSMFYHSLHVVFHIHLLVSLFQVVYMYAGMLWRWSLDTHASHRTLLSTRPCSAGSKTKLSRCVTWAVSQFRGGILQGLHLKTAVTHFKGSFKCSGRIHAREKKAPVEGSFPAQCIPWHISLQSQTVFQRGNGAVKPRFSITLRLNQTANGTHVKVTKQGALKLAWRVRLQLWYIICILLTIKSSVQINQVGLTQVL